MTTLSMVFSVHHKVTKLKEVFCRCFFLFKYFLPQVASCPNQKMAVKVNEKTRENNTYDTYLPSTCSLPGTVDRMVPEAHYLPETSSECVGGGGEGESKHLYMESEDKDLQ